MDRTVRLWDLGTGQPRGEPLTGHDAPLRWVAINPDGRTLATAGTDGTIQVHYLRGLGQAVAVARMRGCEPAVSPLCSRLVDFIGQAAS